MQPFYFQHGFRFSWSDQLQIFWQVYITELIGFLMCLGLLELRHLIYPGLSTGFGIFTSLSLMEFSGLVFSLISALSGFGWIIFARKQYPVNAGVSRSSILGPTLTLTTFQMMFSVELLSILMRLLSTLGVISYLICGNN